MSKEASMLTQKAMIAANYDRLTRAREDGRAVVSTFVPGNLNELLLCFDVVSNLPEINAINNGMRQKSRAMIADAERMGLSEDVCTYVKADLGLMAGEALAPNGRPLPRPDLLLLSATGCFTFIKWFELLRDRLGCETVMLQIPYDADGRVTDEMRGYVVRQLREDVIPALERVSGVRFDIDRLREYLREAARAEEEFVWVLESAKSRPSPIDAYFGGCYYIGPIFTAFRGTPEATAYYRQLRSEVAERLAEGQGPMTPDGRLEEERYRLVIEGPPNWTSFQEFWRMFADEGAVCVASTYTKVGGVYDLGFRHDPDHPLESLADYCLGCYTNRSLPSRVDLLVKYMEEYDADGLLINSIKSCNSFSAGQLLMMREVERRTGRPTAFIETDLVDPRYFSASNVRNRLESWFQMIDQRRGAR